MLFFRGALRGTGGASPRIGRGKEISPTPALLIPLYYRSWSHPPRSLSWQFEMGMAPIKLSYHGQSHYNSVRDYSLRYPLHPRRYGNMHVDTARNRQSNKGSS